MNLKQISLGSSQDVGRAELLLVNLWKNGFPCFTLVSRTAFLTHCFLLYFHTSDSLVESISTIKYDLPPLLEAPFNIIKPIQTI